MPGQPLMISCDPGGKGKAVTWKKDNKVIPADKVTVTVLENGTSSVTVAKPTKEDAGVYECEHGGDKGTINVHYKVTLKMDDSQTTASSAWVEGKEVRLTVLVTGLPPPTLNWTKGRVPLKVDSRVKLAVYQGVKDAMLMFSPIMMSDEGAYTCLAENKDAQGIALDKETFNYTITVKGKYAALFPFLGICAEVLVLCTIIYVFERKAINDVPQPTAAAEEDAGPPQDAPALTGEPPGAEAQEEQPEESQQQQQEELGGPPDAEDKN